MPQLIYRTTLLRDPMQNRHPYQLIVVSRNAVSISLMKMTVRGLADFGGWVETPQDRCIVVALIAFAVAGISFFT